MVILILSGNTMKNTMLRNFFKIFEKTADWTVKHSTLGYLADFHLQMDASAANANTFGTNLDVKRRLLLCCGSHVKYAPCLASHFPPLSQFA